MKTTEQQLQRDADDRYPGPTDWKVSTEKRRWTDEDIRNAWDAAREFDSIDGVVDIHIVCNFSGDNSDLQPVYATVEDWLEQYKAKKQ